MAMPEFAGLRAISGTAVAKRCALLASPAKRQLLWFIQGMSVADGGLKKLVGELVKMFPKRLDTNKMELRHFDNDDDRDESLVLRSEDAALGSWKRDCRERDYWFDGPVSMEEFLIDLCINPRLQIQLKEEEVETSDIDRDLARDEFPELQKQEFRDANLSYFRDIVGALVEYKQRYEERVRSGFCHTAISRQIWQQLDFALKSKAMIVIEGPEGRGKTDAITAWCNCHLGEARFISLKGRVR